MATTQLSAAVELLEDVAQRLAAAETAELVPTVKTHITAARIRADALLAFAKRALGAKADTESGLP